MQDELNQFERNQIWTLTARVKDHPLIGTKWIFKKELHETKNVVRNKARLVAKWYNQEEGIDFDEIFAPRCTIRNYMHGITICIINEY